jgi:hypothetical protein
MWSLFSIFQLNQSLVDAKHLAGVASVNTNWGSDRAALKTIKPFWDSNTNFSRISK